MEPERIPLVLVLVLPALAWFLGSATRWVASGDWLVVTRRGVIHRISGAGLAFRLPVVEGANRLDSGPQDVGLTVRARTAEGTEVRVLVEATVRVEPPRPGTTFADPVPPLAAHLEALLGSAIRACPTGRIVAELEARAPEIAHRARTAGPGARVERLAVRELDVVLLAEPVELGA